MMGLILFWGVLSCMACGVWAIMRQQQKARIEEMSDDDDSV